MPETTLPFARLGEYRLLRRVGRGGMGEVYEAVQESLGRRVAIKILSPDFAREEEMVRRFRREAAAAAAVAHPNLVAVYGAGEEGGVHYFAMEYVDGETLSEAIARSPGGLPPGVVIEIGRQVARGLAAAHAAGIVHRDIKPSNLILRGARLDQATTERVGVWETEVTARLQLAAGSPETGGGVPVQVVVADFGLARPFGGSDLTASGVFVGTPAYMAPEQLSGRAIDGRADLYALGMVLYEAATGRNPFRSDDLPAVVARVLSEEPPPPRTLRPDLGASLEAVISKAIAKDPERRFSTAQEFEEELGRVARGERVETPRVATARRGGPPSRLVVILSIMAGSIVLLFALFHAVQRWGPKKQVEDARGIAARGERTAPPAPGPDWGRVERRTQLGLWEELPRELAPILAAEPENGRARYLRALAVLSARCLRVYYLGGGSRPLHIAADSPDFDRLTAGYFNRWIQAIDPAEASSCLADLDVAILAGHEVARSRFCRAACRAAAGEFEEALQELAVLLEEGAGPHVRVARGLVLLAAGRPDEAEAEIDRGLDGDREAPASWHARSTLLGRRGDAAKAQTAFEEGNRLWQLLVRRAEDPDGLYAQLLAIELDSQAGKYAEVEAALDGLRSERERWARALPFLLERRRGGERDVLWKCLSDVCREESREILLGLPSDPDEELEAISLRLLAHCGEDVSERARSALDRLPDQRWHVACALLIAGAKESADELGSLALSAPTAAWLVYEPYGWLARERASGVHRQVAATASHPSRLTAIEFLGWFGAPSDVSLLTRLLDDPTAAVAEAAARSLGRLGYPEAEPALATFHEKTGSLSSAWGLRVLGSRRFGNGFDYPVDPSRLDLFHPVSGYYFQLPAPELFEPCRAALARTQGASRIVVAAALASVAEREDVPRLCELIDSAGPTERRFLVRALGLLGDPRAAEPLARLAAAARPGLRRLEVFWALARCGGEAPTEEGLPEARRYLSVHHGRLLGAELLARRGDPQARAFLSRAVERELPRPVPNYPWAWEVELQPESLAFQAAEALALVGERSGLLALTGFLASPDPRERRQADRTLWRMTGKSVEYDPLSPRPRLEAARDEWRRILAEGG